MNFTQSFEEFSSSLGPMDLALYAGVGIIVWVLFKDKMSPVQELVLKASNWIKDIVSSLSKNKNNATDPVQTTQPVVVSAPSKDVFFDLIVSWKQTRDLAVKSGCPKAVEVADQMFPYLSPTICQGTPNSVKEPYNAE